MARPVVAVIGGGFTGAAFAVHLARAARQALDIQVIEPRTMLGAGLAYGSAAAEHRINVPSDRMDVFREDPTHFTRWLHREGLYADDWQALTPDGHHYSRRRDFGRYMADLVRETGNAAASGCTVRHVHAKVQGVSRMAEGVVIELDDGTRTHCVASVIAASHAAPVFPWAQLGRAGDHPGLVRDPWDVQALDRVPATADVVIAGTGLTMCDIVVSLRQRGHRGRILAVSRRALLPRVQSVFHDRFDLLRGESAPRTGRFLLRLVRRRVADAERAGVSWRAALDAMRRALPTLWSGLPMHERTRVVRWLRPWWDVHRFRMAPQVAATIAHGQQEGWLELGAGRIRSIADADGGTLGVSWVTRCGESRIAVCGAFVNCIGPDSDLRRSSNPLFRSILDQGLARVDALRLGLDCDADGCLRDAHGRADPLLRVAGPLARATVGEVTGVPEASDHARRVAERLAALPELQGMPVIFRPATRRHTMTRYILSRRAAPPPRSARYSHAVEVDGYLYVTGQLPVDPAQPDAPLPPTIEAQTELVFRNLESIVEDAGYALIDTVFARVYLTDFDRDFVSFNAVYHRHFCDDSALPGRTTVGVARLGRGALVEVDLVLARRA